MNTQTDFFGGMAPAVNLDQDALGFLIKFKNSFKGQSFSSEQVTLAAMDVGIAFPDSRSWGPIYATAAREGHIRRSDVLYRREFGNGILSPGWVGV